MLYVEYMSLYVEVWGPVTKIHALLVFYTNIICLQILMQNYCLLAELNILEEKGSM